MNLPLSFADEVIQAIIEQFLDEDDDSLWHGGCLALAELSRRGLLLPDKLVSVIPILQKAIQFDVTRGQHSVGAHVRDAACYVCWAFARAYSPDILRPFLADLTSSLLITALYDREINCRRAASAAFQENVGRQGNENVPFGIQIMTLTDYFSLGNRNATYLSIAPSIAAYQTRFVLDFSDHLACRKIYHWDEAIRILSSKALGMLAQFDQNHALQILDKNILECFSITLIRRHGALLAVSEILSALSHVGYKFSDELIMKIADIAPALDKARLYRGRGAEILRIASCYLIENIAHTNLKLTVKLQVTLCEILNENLRQPHEIVQNYAAKALRVFLFVYFPIKVECSQKLLELTVIKYITGLKSESNVAATRGYALGNSFIFKND